MSQLLDRYQGEGCAHVPLSQSTPRPSQRTPAQVSSLLEWGPHMDDQAFYDTSTSAGLFITDYGVRDAYSGFGKQPEHALTGRHPQDVIGHAAVC